MQTTYFFDPAWTAELDRLRGLEALFDEDSMHHMRGLGLAPGWQCLEVGCGAGGIASRFADAVGDSGHVVALDLDTRFVDGQERRNLEVRRQDLMAGPLEAGVFDLVHARAVLEYIPDRQQALERMASTLHPGGWVVVEGFDFGGPMSAVLAGYVDPGEDTALFERLFDAYAQVFEKTGADPHCGRQLIHWLRGAGLEQVGGAMHAPLVAGGKAAFFNGSVEYVRKALVGTGLLSDDEVERVLAVVADTSHTHVPPMMVTAWGRRPRS